LTAKQIAAVTKIMSDQHLNIDAKKLTSRASILVKEEYPRSCVQIICVRCMALTAFMEISRSMDVDISFQEDNIV
jgi:phosphoserine phosphatase